MDNPRDKIGRCRLAAGQGSTSETGRLTLEVDLSDVSRGPARDYVAGPKESRPLRTKPGATGEDLLVASDPGSEPADFQLQLHVSARLEHDDLRQNARWPTKVRFPAGWRIVPP